jgi:ornithine decarboxylase
MISGFNFWFSRMVSRGMLPRMAQTPDRFSSVEEMLRAWQPGEPVYCIYPHVYLDTAQTFVGDFPGRVLYAVKANDEPAVVRLLHQGGVRHFDCASLPEVALVKSVCPQAHCYFMVPVSLREAAGTACREHGVRHFMVDHAAGLDLLADEIPMSESVIFARMAVSHASASMDLSSKFGALPEDMPDLLRQIRERGAEPALAFNVGTLVKQPAAYRHAIEVAAQMLEQLEFRVRLIDIGGGFPRAYPGFPVPPLDEFISTVKESAGLLPMQENGEILAEPGRALSAPGLSAVVEVLLRKDKRLYLNDGMYGVFWELRFEAHKQYPVRAYRRGKLLTGPEASFTLYGPTCDASDVLPGEVLLPRDIRAGDHLEFGHIGAYSLAGRTRFNGHYSDRIIEITSEQQFPPA